MGTNFGLGTTRGVNRKGAKNRERIRVNSHHNVGGLRISNNISGRASQATGIFDLKTGMEPQMHTDTTGIREE